jgi:hypothetical protein
MQYSDIENLTNAEAVAQYKDFTNGPIPCGEVEFFLSQNGLAKRNAITGSWEGVLIDAISTVPDLATLFEHLNGPRNVSVNTTEQPWAGLCGDLLTSLLAASVITQEVADDFVALGGGHVYPNLDEAYFQAVRDEETQRLADEAAQAIEDGYRAAFDAKLSRYNELYNMHIAPLQTQADVTDADWVAALQAMSDEFIVVE